MTIDIIENCIYHFDENRKRKQHIGFSTLFSNFEVLSDGRILVIENYVNYVNGNNSNLYCINKNIEIEWFVPTTVIGKQLDLYVGFTTNGSKVFANTWSCFRVEIDTNTGQIINRTYTK